MKSVSISPLFPLMAVCAAALALSMNSCGKQEPEPELDAADNVIVDPCTATRQALEGILGDYNDVVSLRYRVLPGARMGKYYYYYDADAEHMKSRAKQMKARLDQLRRSQSCSSYRPVIIQFSMGCTAAIQFSDRLAAARARRSRSSRYSRSSDYRGWAEYGSCRKTMEGALSNKSMQDGFTKRGGTG